MKYQSKAFAGNFGIITKTVDGGKFTKKYQQTQLMWAWKLQTNKNAIKLHNAGIRIYPTVSAPAWKVRDFGVTLGEKCEFHLPWKMEI